MAKRLMAKVDSYEKDGQVKGKYLQIGVLLENENGPYALFEPTVNLAGVLQKQNKMNHAAGKPVRDMVMASIFDNSQQGQQGGQQTQQTEDSMSDDIPF